MDVLIENDNMSSVCQDSNFRQDTDSTASTEENILSEQTGEPTQEETFSVVVKTTNDLTSTQTSQTHTDIRQVPINLILQQALRSSKSIFSLLSFFSSLLLPLD